MRGVRLWILQLMVKMSYQKRSLGVLHCVHNNKAVFTGPPANLDSLIEPSFVLLWGRPYDKEEISFLPALIDIPGRFGLGPYHIKRLEALQVSE